MQPLKDLWCWFMKLVSKPDEGQQFSNSFGCLEMSITGDRTRRSLNELKHELDNTCIKDEDIVQMVERVTARTPIAVDGRWKKLADAGLFDPRCSLDVPGLYWSFLAIPEVKELRGWRYPIVSVVPTFILTEQGASVSDFDPISYPEGNIILLDKLLVHIQKQNLVPKGEGFIPDIHN